MTRVPLQRVGNRHPDIPFAYRPAFRPGRRLALATLLLAALSGCAGTEGVPGLNPPHPEVPAVPENAFITLGTNTDAPKRPPPLTAEQQRRLQHDLESAARQQKSKDQQDAN